MAALHPNLRKRLEKTVVKAREVAEAAAGSSLKALAVDHHQYFEHMSPEQRELRVRLRSHGRAIGDRRDGKGQQEIYHLIIETAYQHWHRMLFARFLEENNLLMHPDGVPVTLDECEELAAKEGIDKWELASRYASSMLPAIFRQHDPTLELTFAPEHQQVLEKLLSDLESDIFYADDSLGWVYQFWQSKKKDEVNASGNKIGADELPAVTQLFTEDYMVKFLLHNSLGAWWASRFLSAHPDIASNKGLAEDDLRNAVSFDDYTFDYVRFIFDEDTQMWEPAAGCFEDWPSDAKNITILDPCCGSGHFLVAIFELMVRIRSVEEGLLASDAINAVIRENLFGLEVDARCTQIAAFAVALSAWTYPGAEGYRLLPDLNIACSGTPVATKKEEWLALADGNETLKNGMDRLWTLFRESPVLGSLINPSHGGGHELLEASFEGLQPLLEKALESEKKTEECDLNEAAVAAKGIAKAANLLNMKYQLVLTNVPFVGTRKQAEPLREYCDRYHPKAKHDLSTCLIERSLSILDDNGTAAFVSPHNWHFLGAYKSFRTDLLKSHRWNLVALLGPRSFQTPMYDFSITLTIMSRHIIKEGDKIRGISVEENHTPAEKEAALAKEVFLSVAQAQQLKNPDQRITLAEGTNLPLLQEDVKCLTGVLNGDSPKFIRQFWEFHSLPKLWIPLQGTVTSVTFYGGREQVIYFDKKAGHLREDPGIRREKLHNSDERGNSLWGKDGVMVHRMGSLPTTIYTGDVYDQNGAAVVPDTAVPITSLWSFLSSTDFCIEVRRLDSKVGVTPATLAKVPFDKEHWARIAESAYPHGLPEPFTDDPTQWIFHGHPCGSVVWDERHKRVVRGTARTDGTVLQIAVARLLGYRWPAELEADMRLSHESREWIKQCDDLLGSADMDGIVCIPAAHGEQPAEDRLRTLLAASFGQHWSPAKETELLVSVEGKKGLDDWLRNTFFAQHSKIFGNRPFIWHIWDGEKDGFAALVNYHKLDRKLLDTLTYSYLGDWINKQKRDFEAEVAGTERRMLAAQILQKKLQLILRGEKPYDIFVRWKPIEEQSIGWEPDLNDGVRINIRPFVEAGILRKNPNIQWTKDRGKEPQRSKEQYPWFWNGDKFTGNRVNDVHLSLQEKQQARDRVAKEGKTA